MTRGENMPQCQNCNQKWSTGKTLKAHFDYNQGTTCPNCNEVQYVSRYTKELKGFILLGHTITTFLAWRVFDLATLPFFAVAILTVVIGIFILIFKTKLSNEVESSW